MAWLQKFKQLVEEAQKRHAKPVDIEQFNHPLAGQTEWHPLKGGGANFQTHQLDSSNPDQLVFKATRFTQIFSGIFTVVGIIGLVVPLAIFFYHGAESWWLIFFALVFGGLFTAAGAMLFYYTAAPKVFDTFYNCYYVGRKKPQDTLGRNQSGKRPVIDFNDIKAIQVLSERISSKNGSYLSYEINLVLADASRINVIDHGKHETVINDAQKLATQLGVPFWDAS